MWRPLLCFPMSVTPLSNRQRMSQYVCKRYTVSLVWGSINGLSFLLYTGTFPDVYLQISSKMCWRFSTLVRFTGSGPLFYSFILPYKVTIFIYLMIMYVVVPTWSFVIRFIFLGLCLPMYQIVGKYCKTFSVSVLGLVTSRPDRHPLPLLLFSLVFWKTSLFTW